MTLNKNEIIFSGHQPNFLPYLGFFYKMFRSDVFVLDDDVQYSSKAWHNCNFINVNGSRHRITIPVKYEYGDPINKVKITYERGWLGKLKSTLQMNYGRAIHFSEGMELLRPLFDGKYTYLSDLNTRLIQDISERFEIDCKILVASRDLKTDLTNNERNVWQCKQVGGTVYYSGTGGSAYNDEEMYSCAGIKLVYSDYKPVVYRQSSRKPFVENLSVIDYIFNCGFEIPTEWGEQT